MANISASTITSGKLDPARLPPDIGGGSVTLTGDITGTGSGSIATTLATAQAAAHTWAAIQTFTLAPVFTDASGTRTALGLGTLSTQNGTFSGTSSGTNTGDQTSVSGNAGTATALQTARTIDGVNFDGTANITTPANRLYSYGSFT